ncbi:MAG: CotH kinase family protein [Polyangiales bacterium]
MNRAFRLAVARWARVWRLVCPPYVLVTVAPVALVVSCAGDGEIPCTNAKLGCVCPDGTLPRNGGCQHHDAAQTPAADGGGSSAAPGTPSSPARPGMTPHLPGNGTAAAPAPGPNAGTSGVASPPSSGNAGAASPAGSGSAGAPPAAGSGSDPGPAFTSEPEDPAQQALFDQSRLLTYNLQIAEADLAMLDANPGAEEYVQAMLELDGQVYGPIGVRYKGGYSGFQPPCANGVGSPRVGKCSIKLAFDEYDKEARFFGLRKLNLHTMNTDPSLMHDRLGYTLFREFGVAAPRAMHARVFINGEPAGLFIAVEQVDGRFSRARFADGEGNTYKEIWPLYYDPAVYVSSLETNKAEAQVQNMLAFTNAVQSGSSADVERFVDREYMLRFSAVDRVIMNDDGVFHFWCSEVASGNSPTDLGNHNYYWYEEPASSRFWLIPWDLDITFTFQLDAHIILPWHQSGECKCMQQGAGYQVPAACDPLVKRFIEWKPEYERLVDEFLVGPFAQTAVDAKLDAWSAQVADSVTEFVATPNAPAVATWRSALDKLKQDIVGARANRGYAY